MIDKPGDHPGPHPELDGRTPLAVTLKKGTVIFRLHRRIHDPLFFGKTGDYRFDAPDCPNGSFGVMYAGADPHCCFIESCGQTMGVPAVSGDYLTDRHIAEIELMKDLSFIDLAGTGALSHVGADARLMSGSYPIAQQWSAALRGHPVRPNGLRYLSRRDPTRIAFAIYDCPRSTFRVTNRGSLMDSANRLLLNELLSLYNVDLIDV
jgi:hypothetical protein